MALSDDDLTQVREIADPLIKDFAPSMSGATPRLIQYVDEHLPEAPLLTKLLRDEPQTARRYASGEIARSQLPQPVDQELKSLENPRGPKIQAREIVAIAVAMDEALRREQVTSDEESADDLAMLLSSYADGADSPENDDDPGSRHHELGDEHRRLVWHLRAEGRNRRAAREAKRHHGYHCQVCGFNFGERYGDLGRAYIEAHHLTPFSELTPEPRTVDSTTDFAVVCANCHRMLHRRTPPLSPDDLRRHLTGS